MVILETYHAHARKYMSTLYYMINFKPILPSEKISNEAAIVSFK